MKPVSIRSRLRAERAGVPFNSALGGERTLNRLRVLLVMGTRPEAIKMAPVVSACKARSAEIEPIVCFTGQHREMLAQVADYFQIKADINLDLMRPNQTLSSLTARCLEQLDRTLNTYEPDCVVAQGDTTTVMVASLVSFYHRLPFVHVEAGLRTGNILSPWPEELNRCVAGLTASLHCAPTEDAANHLRTAGVTEENILVTGNTVIDALLNTVERERTRSEFWERQFPMLAGGRMVLITGHRRENFGQGMENICQAITTLATSFPEVDFVYPVHLNPNVRNVVERRLRGRENLHLIEPQAYPAFVWLMDRSSLILTDSGGVQEEAPSLRKPVVVMRDTTERPEAVAAGAAELVGTSPEAIATSVSDLLENPEWYAARQIEHNPYGDGTASRQIVQAMLDRNWARRQVPLRRAA